MLQSMGRKRVEHNRVTERQQIAQVHSAEINSMGVGIILHQVIATGLVMRQWISDPRLPCLPLGDQEFPSSTPVTFLRRERGGRNLEIMHFY